MKTLRLVHLAALLAIVLPLLAGCPTPRTVHEKAPENAAQAAQHAIDEAGAAIAAGYSTITKEQASGLLTWSEFIALRDQIDKADAIRMKAEEYYKLADFGSANSRAEIAVSLMKVATRELAAIRAKGPK